MRLNAVTELQYRIAVIAVQNLGLVKHGRTRFFIIQSGFNRFADRFVHNIHRRQQIVIVILLNHADLAARQHSGLRHDFFGHALKSHRIASGIQSCSTAVAYKGQIIVVNAERHRRIVSAFQNNFLGRKILRHCGARDTGRHQKFHCRTCHFCSFAHMFCR